MAFLSNARGHILVGRFRSSPSTVVSAQKRKGRMEQQIRRQRLPPLFIWGEVSLHSHRLRSPKEHQSRRELARRNNAANANLPWRGVLPSLQRRMPPTKRCLGGLVLMKLLRSCRSDQKERRSNSTETNSGKTQQQNLECEMARQFGR